MREDPYTAGILAVSQVLEDSDKGYFSIPAAEFNTDTWEVLMGNRYMVWERQHLLKTDVLAVTAREEFTKGAYSVLKLGGYI